MKPIGIRWLGSLTAAAASAVFASSCSTPTNDSSATTRLAARSPNAYAGRITQVEFGRQAAFARCLPPACPAVSAKTLAVDAQAAPEPPRPMDTAASLGKGETLIAATETAVPVEPSSSRARAAQSDTTMTRQVVVNFAFGDATLTPAARAQIDAVAGALTSARRIAISGRTDSVGPQQSNQLLATARANAVRDHLQSRHPHLVPAVTLEARGACCFVAPNETPQGRALNRRVEVVFERDADNL